MQTSHPAEGERRAIVGYAGQYRVSASLIFHRLEDGDLNWVRVADPEAGQVDDLQIGSQGRVDAYQMKWSLFPKPFSFNDLVVGHENSPGLFTQLAHGWKTLKDRYNNERIVVHLVTSDIPSTRAEVPLGDTRPSPSHFAAFLEQAWKPAQRSSPASGLDVPNEWLPAWNALRDASGLADDEFKEFARDCFLDFNYQVDRFHAISSNERRHVIEDVEQIRQMLFLAVADPARITYLSYQQLIERLGWTDRYEFRNRHIFPVDEETYQPIEPTGREILSAVENLPGGYIAVLGSPGSGKSTLLTKILRDVDARVISYYSYVPDAQTPSTQRGESVNFLHDVVLHLARSGLRTGTGTYGPKLNQLLTTLHQQMGLLSEDYSVSGRKTVIFIDGLDHIDREQFPSRSLLKDLPDPDQVPDGIYFVLGSQTDTIFPARIQSAVRGQTRRIEMQALERQQVFKVIESAGIAMKLTDEQKETVFRLSAGHPLYLAYIINKTKGIIESEDLNKQLQAMVPFEGNIDATYHSYWEQFRDDTDLRRLLGLLCRIRGSIDLTWVREWADNSAVERIGDRFAHYFRIEDVARWRFFHNSFRLFLVDRTAEFPSSQRDPERHQAIHLELAGYYAGQPENNPLAWEEIYHRAAGGQSERVLEIATQAYFRKQFLSLRPIAAINADILIALRAAAKTEDSIAVARLSLIGSELSQRDYHLDESDVLSILWRLGKKDLALGRLMQGNRLLVSERTALESARTLKSYGYDEEAQRAFQLGEPIGLLYGTDSAVTDDTLGLAEVWAGTAVLFRDIDQIVRIIRSLKYRYLDRRGADSEDSTPHLQARLLIQAGIQLTAQDRRSDLLNVIDAFCTSSTIDALARFRLIVHILKGLRASEDNELIRNLLNMVNGTDRSLLTPSDITNLAEAVYRHLGDEVQSRELLEGVEQPELRSDLVTFSSDLTPFKQRFVLNRLLYALGQRTPPSEVVPDSSEPLDKGTVLLERGLCSMAQIWARAWTGATMDRISVKAEVLPLLRLASMSEQNPGEWTTWHVFRNCRSKFYSQLVAAVGQHGEDALLGLAESVEEEWTDARSRGHWSVDDRRTFILAFIRAGFSRNWAKEKLLELDELVTSALESYEVGERVHYCVRQAEAWLELNDKEWAQHFLALAVDVGFGVGFRKDYQLNRWIEWLGEINELQPGEASKRITSFAHAIESVDEYAESPAVRRAAEELLAVTFGWSPGGATRLFLWFLERGLIGYQDGVRVLIDVSLKGSNPPVQTILQVFVELLLPFDTEGDSELIKSILRKIADIQGSDRALEIAKSLAAKIRILTSPPARDAWLEGLTNVLEELGFNRTALGIDVDEIKFAQEDTRSRNFLRLEDHSEEIGIEDVQGRVSAISDVRRLMDKEDRFSYFDWTPVVERLILKTTDEEYICEFADLFRNKRNHSSEVLSAISRRLNQLGSNDRAWDAGVEALEKSSEFGWNPFFDSGAKYVALRALRQVDRNKTVTRTYQSLVEDLEANQFFTEVTAGLDEILEIVDCNLDVPAIWTEIEEHAEFLMPEGVSADLPDLIMEIAEDTPQRALQILLLEFICHPIPAVVYCAQRILAKLMRDGSTELKSVIREYLQKSESHQERILAVIDAVGRVDPPSVSHFRGDVEALIESPDWAIRRISASISEIHGWKGKSKSTSFKLMPWMHNLATPSQTIVTPKRLSGFGSGRPLRRTDDMRVVVSRLFSGEIRLISESTSISADSILRRVVALMYEFDRDQSDLTASTERRLRKTLESVGLWMSFRRPRVEIARRAFFLTVVELEDAGKLHPQVAQVLDSGTLPYDPDLIMLEPSYKPAEISAMDEFLFDTDRKEWTRDVMAALKRTNWKPSAGRTVVAEKTVLVKQGEWELPTECRYSQLVMANSAYLFSKPSASTFFSETWMTTVSEYAEAASDTEETPLVLINYPRSIDSPGADWLALNPLVANKLGWSSASEGLFRWVDSDGRVMVESFWWANGLPMLRALGSGMEEASEGWVVLATQEALAAIKSEFGSLFRVSLVSRETRDEGKSLAKSAFETRPL